MLEVGIHGVMVHGHEERVDDDTQSNEQIGEGIENNQCSELLYTQQPGRAVPHAEELVDGGSDKYLLVHTFIAEETYEENDFGDG